MFQTLLKYTEMCNISVCRETLLPCWTPWWVQSVSEGGRNDQPDHAVSTHCTHARPTHTSRALSHGGLWSGLSYIFSPLSAFIPKSARNTDQSEQSESSVSLGSPTWCHRCLKTVLLCRHARAEKTVFLIWLFPSVNDILKRWTKSAG